MHLSRKNNKSTFVQKKLIEFFLKDYSNSLYDNLNFCIFFTVDYLVDANAIDYIKSLTVDYDLSLEKLILILDEQDVIEQVDRIEALLDVKENSGFKFYLNSFGEKYLALRPLFELEFDGVFLDTKVFKKFITNNQDQEMLLNIIKNNDVMIVADKISSDYDLALMLHYGITYFSGEFFRTVKGANEIKDYKN